MNPAVLGVACTLFYAFLEATQFVFFGGLFQRMSSFQFGFLVFGLTAVGFVGGTALGPFVIFGLQAIEGRVAYSEATLLGLSIYFAGSLLSAFGAVRATATQSTG